jgi:hypothetical protein
MLEDRRVPFMLDMTTRDIGVLGAALSVWIASADEGSEYRREAEGLRDRFDRAVDEAMQRSAEQQFPPKVRKALRSLERSAAKRARAAARDADITAADLR